MPSSAYEKWRRALRKGDVDVRALQADVDALAVAVDGGEADLRERRAALKELRADMLALRSLRNFVVHGTPGGAAPFADEQRVRPRAAGSRRDAILSILADGQPLHTSAIRHLLVEAGEMRSDQAAYHSLQVTLSQMYRADELERVARGVYRRPPVSDEEILQVMAHEA